MNLRLYVSLLLSGLALACQDSKATEKVLNESTVSRPEPRPEPLPVAPPPADGFDFPVGPPDAKGFYNAQGFRRNNHLGDDWNGTGGGNSDLGDPVFAIANGIVKEAADFGGGWGNVVRVVHNAGTANAPQFVESLYAHLDTLVVGRGDTLHRGQQIGTIGDAHGAYWAHLHFEIRVDTSLGLGGGYSTDTTGFVNPTRFIRSHRPDR